MTFDKAMIHTLERRIDELEIEIGRLRAIGENQPKWIPASERLPEKCGSYLITLLIKLFPSSDEYVTEIHIAYYSTLSGKWLHHSNDFEIVSAWMPLPESYEAENEGEE